MRQDGLLITAVFVAAGIGALWFLYKRSAAIPEINPVQVKWLS